MPNLNASDIAYALGVLYSLGSIALLVAIIRSWRGQPDPPPMVNRGAVMKLRRKWLRRIQESR